MQVDEAESVKGKITGTRADHNVTLATWVILTGNHKGRDKCVAKFNNTANRRVITTYSKATLKSRQA